MSAHESYSCTKCGKTTFPTFVLSMRGKLVAQCANQECLFEDASLGPADFNRGVASMTEEGAAPTQGWAGKRAIVVDTQASQQAAPSAPRPPPIAVQSGPVVRASQAPTDVIGMIEERAMWLSSEEARLSGVIAQARAQQAGVRAEGKSLQRMLRAAHRVVTAETFPAQQVALRIVGDR
jgi:hypothetical protein